MQGHDTTIADDSLGATLPGEAHDPLAATVATGGGAGPREPVRLQRGAALGRYLVLGPLGAGGMGVVYAAYDPELDRKVAIKLWHAAAGAATSADLARGRLQREAQALAKLQHPNVVAVYDVGTHDNRVFVAMEHIDGWTLTQWLADERRGVSEIVEVFAAAGRGLAAAHACGLVHRDIKPDNIMIGRDGRVRVMDFGLARSHGTLEPQAGDEAPELQRSLLSLDLTRTGGMLGTPAYMSPEQFHRQATDARSDQFSFCVSLWEAVYGEGPFAGETLVELAHNVVSGHVRPPPRGAAVPGHLHRLLLRGLRAAPEERWPSMDALLVALADDPRARRRRWWIGGALAAVTGVALALALTGEQADRCAVGEARWAEVWPAARAEQVKAALLATGRAHASGTATRVLAALEQYGQAWTAMHREACLATHARGEQSDSLLDLRMRCLGQRLREVDALAQQFVAADAEAADRAIQATAALTPVAACGDVDALLAAVPPPTDPAERAAADALRGRLAEVDSMYELGRYTEGRRLAEAVLEDSKALGHPPLVGDALRTAGELAVMAGDPATGEARLQAAIEASAAARDLEGHARAWVALTRLTATSLRRPQEALHWSRAMAAAVQLLPASQSLRARARNAAAQALRADGQVAAAVVALEEARALFVAAHGPDHPGVANLDGSLGSALRELGRQDEARAAFTRGLELALRVLGESHPSVAAARMNLANLATDAGDYETARREMVAALELREATLGPQHFLVAQTRYNVAHIDMLRGDREAARRGGEAALASFEQALGPAHADVAYPLNFLGVLAQNEGRLDDAEPLFTRALAISTAALGEDNPELGSPLNNLGLIALDRERPDEAASRFARVLALWEKAYGPEHVELTHPLVGLARAALGRGQPEEALALAERVLALVESLPEQASARAEARYLIAAALVALRRTPERARALAEAARAELPDDPHSRKVRVKVEALLAKME
ncbi:tetratricopeptide repeat protein [Nannocystis pusilla]|uniref:tetratricopeptide repeat protein n=1 Tax=Nannocystis pusilla TaxID=889268 RepID=UPI003BF1BEBC